jgi:tetratricopeptide (TPR) repeat protein
LIQASIADLDDTANTVVTPPDVAAHGFADPRAAWRRVWELAGSDHEWIQAARGLARVGVRDVDGLEELLVATPEFAAEFDQLAQLAPRPGERPSAVRARLRAQRRHSLFAATRLAELLMGDGQAEDAADVLAEAADVFDDQQMRLAAASMLCHAGHRDAAAEQARDALTRSGSTWSDRRQARQILHDATVEAGRWADAAQLARTLLADDPADETSRWCLVSALCQQGRFDEAWSAVLDAPVALEARDLRSTVLLLELTARFGDRAALWTLAADLIGTHLNDERLAARALVLAYVPPTHAENADRAHDADACDPDDGDR